MQKTTSILGLGLALLSSASSVALAGGDWPTRGSSKDYISDGLPVPAPAPIPSLRAEWYLRGDFAYGFAGGKPSSSISGQTLGDSDGATGAINPFGVGCGVCTTDIVNNPLFSTSGGLLTGGIGVGYYLSSRIRTDVTAELRSTTKIKLRDSYNYLQYSWQGGPPPDWLPVDATNDLRTFGAVRDDTNLKGGVFLLNAYYDLSNHGPFTPYVGAGVGVTMNTLSRSQSISEYECSVGTDPDCTGAIARPGSSAHDKVTNFSLAAQATAGLTYRISSSTQLDMNYRMLWLQGTHIDLAVNGQTSRLEIADTFQHQIRAGLRWDID